MRCRSVGRCLRCLRRRSVGQRFFADVVTLVGAVDVVPLPGDPDVGTIFVAAAVIGFSLLPKPERGRTTLSQGGGGTGGGAFPGTGRRAAAP